ncbi:MAG: DJ-1/PfpI family protein [Actinomycetota bacterium]|nr:DJ-1/PfpI family protein [Actinomycetota bacterium]
MQVAILLFDRFTALDAVGPYEVLCWLPESDVRFVAAEPGLKRNHPGSLALLAEYSLDDVPSPDVIVVPGGPGEEQARADERVLAWLRQAHATSQWTTSVCTGALTLASAGILRGVEATTHWLVRDDLRAFGAIPVTDRVVARGKIITSAGVSAGIDMALHLASVLAGEEMAQAVQLVLEYDPQPPFTAGSPEKAPAYLVERLRSSASR